MGFRTLIDALKGRNVRTPVRRAQRIPPLRLAFEALEDRAVPASFSISDVSIVEGNSGTKNALVTVTLTGGTKANESVSYITASGSASAGSDYTSVSGTLNFDKNATSKTISIPIKGDTVVESDEIFYVNLRNAKKATIADGQGVVTILNDDASLSIGDVYQSEGQSGTTSFDFTVNLSNALSQPVTVNYATADGSATAGSDYVATSGKLTIPAGQTSGTITVLVNGDVQSEPTETFYVNLSSPTNATISDSQGAGTIYDDEPYVYISSAYLPEGNAGTTEFSFTVELSSATTVPVTVDFATADDLAIAGDDYVATAGTLTFAPGVTSQTITVQVNGDLTVEPDEGFFVNLSNPTNAQLGSSYGWGTIQSDDNAVLHIESWWDYEPDPYYGDYSTTFYFTVWLSLPSTETVTVDFATADGSAIDGWDYLGTFGTLTFAPGETSQTIEVQVLRDYEYEWTEDFYVALSNPSSNALVQPGWNLGYGTIYDNQGYWE